MAKMSRKSREETQSRVSASNDSGQTGHDYIVSQEWYDDWTAAEYNGASDDHVTEELG